MTPKINTVKFKFEDKITPEQRKFFNQNGFIQFAGFFSRDVVNKILEEMDAIQNEWLNADVDKVNGVPIKWGEDENGNKIVQRFAFASLQNEYLHKLIRDPRFKEISTLLGKNVRIGENEKDGMVINHYINTKNSTYSKLGWHTDSARDIFYGFKIEPMLNVGIYLDDSDLSKGGLRIIPGTHRQNVFNMLTRKRYFIDNKPDPDEAAMVANAGDVTVHHGHMWHRVELSPLQGKPSERRIIYFPIIKGKYKPKTSRSRTPLYHRFQKLVK